MLFCIHFKHILHYRLIGSNGTSGFSLTFYQRLSLYSVWMKGLSLNKNVLPISYENNRKVWDFFNQRIWRALRSDWFSAEYHVFVEKCCNRNVLITFIPLNVFNFNITNTGNTVVVDINFKNLNFKNLIKMLLVLTMFTQRADNLAKLIGTRIILAFANWEHKCNNDMHYSSWLIMFLMFLVYAAT